MWIKEVVWGHDWPDDDEMKTVTILGLGIYVCFEKGQEYMSFFGICKATPNHMIFCCDVTRQAVRELRSRTDFADQRNNTETNWSRPTSAPKDVIGISSDCRSALWNETRPNFVFTSTSFAYVWTIVAVPTFPTNVKLQGKKILAAREFNEK